MRSHEIYTESQGDSNPLQSPWIDTWHKGQYQAFKNDPAAINTMFNAARQANSGESPGEAKYYLATISWIRKEYDKVQKYVNDPDVKVTGNDQILKRLLQNKDKDYRTAYHI